MLIGSKDGILSFRFMIAKCRWNDTDSPHVDRDPSDEVERGQLARAFGRARLGLEPNQPVQSQLQQSFFQSAPAELQVSPNPFPRHDLLLKLQLA